MDDTLELLFGASHDPSEVFAALSSEYRVIAEPTTSERWTCLDTADWRLHDAGITLRDHHRGRVGELVLVAGDAGRLTAPSRVTNWPKHPGALPPSPVRDRVAAAAGVRALLPLAAVDSRRLRLRLLDDLDKTRVRVQIDQQRLTGGDAAPLPLRVVLSPLRGYAPDAERAAELLRSSLAVIDGHPDAVSAALAAAGRTPGVSARAPWAIDPRAPAAVSLARVLLNNLDRFDASRQGAVDDIDIEFLHDLRTSLSATRSILALAGDVLPGGLVGRFGEQFRWLAQLSGPVRDLDVLALTVRGGGEVSLRGLGDLDQLAKVLHRRRRAALRTMRAGLDSARATNLIDEWRGVLTSMSAGGLHGVSTAQVAADRATEAYRRIRKAAAAVDATTSAADLHRLRRRCKRMRYLLTGLEPAYDSEHHATVLAALKKLQDCLGTIQDSDVHHVMLTDAATRFAPSAVEAVLVVGALRDRLDAAALEARDDLDERLARFTSRAMRARVEMLRLAVS